MTINSIRRIKNPDIQHFRTPEAFYTYLANTQAPTWCTKICIHHTVVPTVAQWRGLASMQAMLAYYRRLGWVTFPHIYVAPDGIWQMNNVQLRGTHANAANAFSIGVEVVGNYDARVWEDPIYTYAVDVIQGLLQWRALKDTDIVFHREYNSSKSCPGKAITKDWVRKQIKPADKDVCYRVTQDYSRVRQGPSTLYPVAGQLMKGDVFLSSALKPDEQGMYIGGLNTWAHTTKTVQTSSGNSIDHLGFVHTSLLEIV